MSGIPIQPHVPWNLENPIEIKLGHYYRANVDQFCFASKAIAHGSP